MKPIKTPNTTHSNFRVYHGSVESRSACLGIAKMTGHTVRYTADPKSYGWFEGRSDAFLMDFQNVVRRLCRSVGHTDPFSISTDEDSGITVERI